ncbi:MAG: hypothetical protein WCS70_16005 [Verrucomicrobiota bacterium]
MPAKVIKKDGKYEVKTPNMVHAKGTTKEKAMAQQRLLNAVDHGWKPTGHKGLLNSGR